MTAPLGLNPYPTLVERREYDSCAARAVKVLADIPGQGTLTHLFFALNAPDARPMVDGRLRVYTDHKLEPDFEIDLGTLFTLHNRHLMQDDQSETGKWGTPHLQVDTSRGARAGVGYTFAYDMPFHNGIRVDLVNDTDIAVNPLWSQAYYNRGPAAPLTLRGQGKNYYNRDVVRFDEWIRLVSEPGNGWVVYQAICGRGVTIGTVPAWDSWLERNVRFITNGSPADVVSTGMEDWFGGAFYYQGRQMISAQTYMVGVNRMFACSQGVDLLEQHGGLRFTGGFSLWLDTEPVCRSGHEMSHVALFYKEI